MRRFSISLLKPDSAAGQHVLGRNLGKYDHSQTWHAQHEDDPPTGPTDYRLEWDQCEVLLIHPEKWGTLCAPTSHFAMSTGENW